MVFYKWILGQEDSLTIEDLVHVDSNLYEQLKKFQNIVHRRNQLLSQTSNNAAQSKKRLKSKDDLSPGSMRQIDLNDAGLLLDGCSIDDLSLVFTLPGFPHIELRKSGKDLSVTLENLEQYVDVRKQGKKRKTKSLSGFLFSVDCSLDSSRRCSSTIRSST